MSFNVTLLLYSITHLFYTFNPLSIIHFQLSKPFSPSTLTTPHLTYSNAIQRKLSYINSYFSANKKRKLWSSHSLLSNPTWNIYTSFIEDKIKKFMNDYSHIKLFDSFQLSIIYITIIICFFI